MTKIGRNAPCPCNSGAKFKRCCGRFQEPTLEQRASELFRRHEADQLLRERSEGLGRPIISTTMNNFRIVIVGKGAVFWSKEWRVFPDFLLHFLKHTLGVKWGEAASAAPEPRHPLFGWLIEMNAVREAHIASGKRGLIQSSGVGPMAVYRLAYALYLMAHHDQIPRRFIARLREQETFGPTAYEALVGAVYALSGFAIRAEEVGPTDKPQPEFTVTRQGVSFSVEAKWKRHWTAPICPESQEFSDELQRWLRSKIMAACRKELPNPVYWLELSIPTELTSADQATLQEVIRATLRDVEQTFRIAGVLPAPAYVYVTSHSFMAAGAKEVFSFYMVDGLHRKLMPDEPTTIEELLLHHERHRPATQLLECLADTAAVPTSFDGVPPEALDAFGNPISMMRIGEPFEHRDDERYLRGVIEEATAMGGEAYIVIHNEADEGRYIVKVPLGADMQRAHDAYGDVIFGKPVRHKRGDDIISIYDWLLWAYRTYPRASLLKQIAGHPRLATFEALSDNELRCAAARTVAAAMWAQTERRQVDAPGAGKGLTA